MEVRKLTRVAPGPATPIRVYGYDTSASAWFAIQCDPSGHLAIKQAIDFTIEGGGITAEPFDASATGTTTLKTASASQTFKVYRATISTLSDISATVIFSIGSRNYKARSVFAGAPIPIFNASPYNQLGSVGASLAVQLPGGIKTSVTVYYEP